MGVQFSVESFKKMGETVTGLNNVADEYKNIYTKIVEAVRSLESDKAYLGEDYDIYSAKVLEFADKLEQMEKKIRTGAEALDQQKKNYEKTQDDLAAAANKL